MHIIKKDAKLWALEVQLGLWCFTNQELKAGSLGLVAGNVPTCAWTEIFHGEEILEEWMGLLGSVLEQSV